MAASVAVTNADGFLGLSRTTMAVLAFDPKGESVCNTPAVRDRTYYPPKTSWTMNGGRWTPQLDPYTVSVNVPLDPNRACPVLLSQLEWSMYVLVAGTSKNVDLPFQAGKQWVEVAPGLQVLVEKADLAGAGYTYSIQVKRSPSGVDVSSWYTMLIPRPPSKVILTKVDILDAQGRSIPDRSSGLCVSRPNYPSRAPGSNMTITGSGDGEHCGDATTIRLVVALNSYAKEFQFVLQDIPVPALW